MRRVVVTLTLDEEERRLVQEAVPGWELVAGEEQHVWLPALSGAEVVCGWKPEITEQCLERPSALKWLQAWGAGVDRLPLSAFAERGIVVTTASGVHPNPVSETAFAMMLSFSRKLHESVRLQAEQSWKWPDGLGEIHGKTLGVIGAGTIGGKMAQLGKAFDMTVLGVRHSGEPAAHIDRMFKPGQLNEVLSQCDYVIAIMPLTDATQHLFGREQFAAMKPGAVFINMSRGATVDTEALLEALANGQIAGAGLDVFEQEPLPPDHPFWKLDNVIVTPHVGGVTDQYRQRALRIFVDNLRSYASGAEALSNVVDLGKQY